VISALDANYAPLATFFKEDQDTHIEDPAAWQRPCVWSVTNLVGKRV
jgi:hypothetical protein